MRTLVVYITSMLGCAMLFCSSPTQQSGGGNSTGNAFAGIVSDTAGLPQAGVLVHVYPVESTPAIGNPDSTAAATAITDSLGQFHIGGILDGVYNLEYRAPSGVAALLRDKEIDNTAAQALACSAVLMPTGKIAGSSDGTDRGIAFIKGTSRVSALAPNGTFEITGVPEGSYSVSVLFLNYPTIPYGGPDTCTGLSGEYTLVPGDSIVTDFIATQCR